MINWKTEWRALAWMMGCFALVFWLPVGAPRFDSAVTEALALTRWYAREHVLLCLVPAFFIAGAIASFVSQAAVMKYLGPRAPRLVVYGVASVSGAILGAQGVARLSARRRGRKGDDRCSDRSRPRPPGRPGPGVILPDATAQAGVGTRGSRPATR